MRMRNKLLLACLCLLLLLAMAGCGGKSDSAATTKAKKTVNIGFMNAPSGFNPLEWSDTAQNLVSAILFQPLVELDDDMQYKYQLATAIETKDNQTFTIKIDPKAKWTDGKPVTVDDLIFTLKLASNPQVASSVAASFNVIDGLDNNGKNPAGGDIAGAKKVDAQTLTIKTKAPMDLNLFLDGVGARLKAMPQHVLKDVAPDKLYQHEFMQKPSVSYGSFKLVEYKKGQYIHMTANKDYFKGAPKIDDLYIKIMPGANITAQLQSGEIDMNHPQVGLIPFEDTEKVKAMPNISSRVGTVPGSIQTLMINTKTIPDPKVRKAMSYAINRKMIFDNLLKGDGELIELPYFGKSEFVKKDIPFSDYNPEKAKQLLQEAGWDLSKPINFDVPTGNKVREQVADIITDNLKSVGLNIQVQKYDFVTSLTKAKKGEFDIYIVGIPVYPKNPDLSSILKTGTVLNLSKYSNPEMDELLMKGMNAIVAADRKAIYDRVQDIFYRDLPCPSVYVQYPLEAVNKRLVNARPKAFGTFNNLHEWDIKQ